MTFFCAGGCGRVVFRQSEKCTNCQAQAMRGFLDDKSRPGESHRSDARPRERCPLRRFSS